MRTRQMVVAFLERPSGILMLQRSPTARLFPGVWAGVGGHIEPHELNDPRAAIEREIAEETGLAPDELVGLRLRAVVLRLAGDEMRQQYVYLGTTNRDVPETSPEGRVEWVPRSQVLGLPMSEATRAILSRHLAGEWEDGVVVGVLTASSQGPQVSWVPLRDWEGGPADAPGLPAT
ncbi:MAG: NUDIX domain-containing protein [Thermaerobacter sp.]|nr:NUDIX domain-containing protein [Thermaerobacter sp.]